jgi:hypothetical protein
MIGALDGSGSDRRQVDGGDLGLTKHALHAAGLLQVGERLRERREEHLELRTAGHRDDRQTLDAAFEARQRQALHVPVVGHRMARQHEPVAADLDVHPAGGERCLDGESDPFDRRREPWSLRILRIQPVRRQAEPQLSQHRRDLALSRDPLGGFLRRVGGR